MPTGQTGIAIAGWGIAIDRVIADFAAAPPNSSCCEAATSAPDLIFVEGQGAINHPAYAPVTLALDVRHARPTRSLLVCDPARDAHRRLRRAARWAIAN